LAAAATCHNIGTMFSKTQLKTTVSLWIFWLKNKITSCWTLKCLRPLIINNSINKQYSDQIPMCQILTLYFYAIFTF
jgi:hypothetical protein